MADEKSKSPFEVLNDVSTEKDVLGFRPYVEAIAEFLTAEGTRPPITLSIEGEWGCGKSSFMKQLEKEIRKKMSQGKRQNILLDGLILGNTIKKMNYGLLLRLILWISCRNSFHGNACNFQGLNCFI
nr:P-loop NTPase fold protein [Methanosarcina siciliae]